jgi:hypothetical protein
MRLFKIFILLLSLPLAMNAQTLKGKVYDETSTVKNIKVLNDTQNRVTATNKDGDFNIIAKVNDTILFESIFYHPKAIVLNASHFEGVAVFELVKITNELDEVEIIADPEQPVFEERTYNLELQKLLKEDIKNNPDLYSPVNTNGANILAIIDLVAKLFKNKDKYITPTYTPITYTQMDSLFTNSTFFNKSLLTENLQIPEDKIFFFYDFCDAKKLSSKLLKEENKMEFLEQLVLNSQLFSILLELYTEEKAVKD